MKKMRLILAGILAAVCLTACGGQTSTEEPADTSDPVQEETVETEEPAETEEEPEAAPVEEETEIPEEETEVPAEAGDDAAAESESADSGEASGGLDNFDVDQKEVEAFAEKIKEAVAAQDLEALAELTSFPVYVGVSENGVVETKEEFLELGADTVITPELKEAIEGTDVTTLSASMAGFTMRADGVSGSITFGMTGDGLAITGINY